MKIDILIKRNTRTVCARGVFSLINETFSLDKVPEESILSLMSSQPAPVAFPQPTFGSSSTDFGSTTSAPVFGDTYGAGFAAAVGNAQSLTFKFCPNCGQPLQGPVSE
jgi:hypothetical protein